LILSGLKWARRDSSRFGFGPTKIDSYTVYENNGQLRVTIPKALAVAMGIQKGDRVQWTVVGRDLLLRKI
jgi:hypothetical protein